MVSQTCGDEKMAKHKKATESRAVQFDCDALVSKAIAGGVVRLNLAIQDQDWLAIEGDRNSLAFLGELLQSFAKGEGPGCLILDSPETAVFKSGSLGIYIYRTAEERPKARRRRTSSD